MRNEKARRFLSNMRRKQPVQLELHFPHADPGALRLLKKMLAFDPAGRPTCEEALADQYFEGLSQLGREPSAQPVSKLAFDFERRKLNTAEVGCAPLLWGSRAGEGVWENHQAGLRLRRTFCSAGVGSCQVARGARS